MGDHLVAIRIESIAVAVRAGGDPLGQNRVASFADFELIGGGDYFFRTGGAFSHVGVGHAGHTILICPGYKYSGISTF